MKTIKKHKRLNKNMLITDVVIVGTGNIAIKHVQIIKKKYPKKIITLYNYRKKSLSPAIKKNFDNISSDINLIIKNDSKSFVIIASPANFHINHAIRFAKKGFHLFVEKPLSINTKSIKTLKNIVLDNNLYLYIGYNLRFLDSIKKMSDIIHSKIYGKIKHANIFALSNFIFWRKNKSFKKTVTANYSLGGGAITELSHELDYTLELFGIPKIIKNTNGSDQKHDLDIETKSSIKFYYNDKIVNIYLDILSSYNKRQIYIYFEKADALIDLKNNLIIIQNNKDVYKKYTFKQSINDTYDDQMIDFISKLHRKDFKNFVDSNYLPNMIMNLRKSA